MEEDNLFATYALFVQACSICAESFTCLCALAVVFSVFFVFCWVTYASSVGFVSSLSSFPRFYSLVICLDRRHNNPTGVITPSSGVAVFVTMALCECIGVCV